MFNQGELSVQYDFSKHTLQAIWKVRFNEPKKVFRFTLSNLAEVDNIICTPTAEWKVAREWDPAWQHRSFEYEISCVEPLQALELSYHGPVEGWCNIIEEKRVTLSGYSGWYPGYPSSPIHTFYKLPGMKDYFVINGRYDQAEDTWVYGEGGYDEGNIIALKERQYQVARNGDFSFYYVNEPDKAYADLYAAHYGDIITVLQFHSNPEKAQ